MTDPLVLAGELEAGLGQPIEELHLIPGGASQETWSFDALRPGGSRRPLIARRRVRPPVVPPVDEAALLRAAAAAGVPVPAVVLDEPYLVVERVAGEGNPRRILRDEAFAAVRPRLAAQCGEALARIHQIPLTAVDGLPEPDPVDAWRDALDASGHPHPAFELALRWLDERRPPPAGRVVVHGDFRNGNLIVGPDGVAAVIDWELAHIGDPLSDLAWLCQKAWRYGAGAPVGGFGTVEDLLAAYHKAGGVEVDREALRWWEVQATLRWGVICIALLESHLSGELPSMEQAAVGRRACETEWDLLELIA
ncbi:MAG TPA: phosphotransferase family protein [Acidimicrobiia bacterium]|nr:phosphotransferase family protein [Acidimicrobiia bacterium]